MKIPEKNELVGPEPIMLDEEVVLDHFLGLTNDQFLDRLRISPDTFQEDFMWMAPPGLRYYLPVVLSWIREEQTNSWLMSHGLLCSLSFQVESSELPRDVKALIGEIADYIDGRRAKFDLGRDDLLDEYLRKIRTKAEPAL